MAEPTQIQGATPVKLHAQVTVLTLSGFMDTLRQARLTATRTREKMSQQATVTTFTDPTGDTL